MYPITTREKIKRGVGKMPEWEITFQPRIDSRDRELLILTVQIEAFRLSISKIPLPPRLRAIINRLNIVRQIKGTTGIEGNTLEEDEIAELVAPVPAEGKFPATDDREAEPKNPETLEEREVINAYNVLKHILSLPPAKNLLITEELIRELHSLNTEGCRYANNTPGRYRSCEVAAGEYNAPRHEKVHELMRRFVDFINSREVTEGLGPLIRAILAHFYLVSIHPFADGNGRTARALEAAILYHGGYNTHGFYSLANFYYKNRAEYVQGLQDARFKHQGDLNEFVKFALRGFVKELGLVESEILNYIRKLLFRDHVSELFANDQINWRIANFLEYLISDQPSVPLETFKTRRHHVVEAIYKNTKGTRTLQRDLNTMLKYKLIRIEENSIFPNHQILDTLSTAGAWQ